MTSIKQRAGDLRRLRQIVVELWVAGFDAFLDDLELKRIVPLRTRLGRALSVERRAHLEKPPQVRIRETMERLGPTFVKFGQMLSLRADLVGEEYAREFSKLQRAVPPFRAAQAAQVIREELGKPPEKIFKEFDKKPFAAASLAQVHRARLRNGKKVAVKIQRPSVRATVENDIHILLLLAHLAERHVPQLRTLRPVRLVREFADWTLRELDFTVEGGQIDRFRANFADEEGVRVPLVYWDYTGKRVLTMEFLDGLQLDDLAGLRRAKIDRKELAETGVRLALRQFFIDGFFHGDPHPGNFTALPGNKLGMMDFGIVGTLPADLRLELVSAFISYKNRDTEAYTKHLLDLAEVTKEADVRGFSAEVQRIINRVIYGPLKKKGISDAFYQVVTSGARHGVYFPTDLVLLGKSLLTIEAVGLKLHPAFDLDATLEPFLSTVIKSELSPRRLAQQVENNAFDALSLARTLPEHTLKLLKKIETGNLEVKLDLEELRDLKQEFDRQNDDRILALVVTALFIGSAAVLRLETFTLLGWSLGRIGFVLSIVLFLWLVYRVRKQPR